MFMRLKIEGPQKQAGFTIVELMIATLVFSVILLVVTYGVLSFSRAYYKGVHSASTQNTARTVIDRFTQAIQFSGGSVAFATATGNPTDPITTYCVGGVQYDFKLGTQQNGTNHMLYETPRDSTATCVPKAFDSALSKDLVAQRMRVANFTISPSYGTEGLFTVHVRIVYGDDDLLISPSGAPNPAIATDAACTGDSGFEYCAMADLTSTVAKRVK